MLSRCVSLLALLTAFACSDGGDDGLPDATAEDAGSWDAGEYDSGVRPDGGVPPDSGHDAGFADPNTLVMGIEDIAETRTYVHVRGTATSTLPPLVVLPTGPHQGGPSTFFGHFGGGIGHEYLPEHLDFLLPDRLMIYFDFKATGRSGFGAVGSATISVAVHVAQVGEVIDWVSETLSIDTGTIDIVGHGYGAGIGALYAVDHPDQVDKLVLIDPMAPEVTRYARAIAELQSRLTTSDRQRLDILVNDPECIGNSSRCTIEVWRILAPHLGCSGNASRINTLMFMYADIRAFDYIRRDLTEDRFNWTPLFPQIQAETTVVSGPCDATPPGVALTYTASITGAVHEIIQDSGHWPMVENNLEFQRVLRNALARP